MILAHFPSGYLLGRTLTHKQPGARWLMAAALLGAVFPDFDLIWFYLIDDRAFHHHRYWVHIPAFWLALALVTLPLLAWAWRPALRPACAFFAAILLHLVLDTLAGDILWAWPWSDSFFHLIDVPAAHSHWVLNFLLHPVALAELAIIAAAAWVYLKCPTQKAQS